MNQLPKLLLWVTIFSVAMAFLETAVVIYLRELLYPAGFKFPLAPMPSQLVLTEILREAATILMLVGAGFMAGKTFSSRFAWFIYAFAIWDIFYYVFLKLLIDWPESLMTWDILFLIPTTWTGPVLSPVIVSITMIVLGMIIIFFSEKGFNTTILRYEWILLIAGSLVLITAFTLDYSLFILERFSLKVLWTLPDKDKLYNASLQYIPATFNWIIFFSGEFLIICMIFRYIRRINNSVKRVS